MDVGVSQDGRSTRRELGAVSIELAAGRRSLDPAFPPEAYGASSRCRSPAEA
jgi:hypothetical protein